MKKRFMLLATLLCVSTVASGCGLLPFAEDFAGSDNVESTDISFTSKPKDETSTDQEDGKDNAAQENEGEQQADQAETTVLEEAQRLAAMYDYDKAIELLKGQAGYDSDTQMQEAVAEFEEQKSQCVAYPIDQITHVFYHTLVKDTDLAFDEDYTSAGYNQVMTTIDEFNAINESMYEKGYVLVSLDDIAYKDENGVMKAGSIMLPPGKKPFVMSQDDVSYYHYMDGDGMATKLVLDENGDVKNEYVETDGSVSVGDYDMVPLLDAFVEEHPDFSYRGAKGTIALTGYNGVLGYRTDEVYKTRDPARLEPLQEDFLNAHPDFNWDQEVADAKEVADAMKANGWDFASHTWGHLNVGQVDMTRLQTDTERWLGYVAPIVGDTDKIIFAFGADLAGAEDYSGEKFEYLKSKGFDYFCNVDSSQYWTQLRDNYFRMGRRNLDGYRMYYNPEMLEDLFDAKAIFDKARPTPVPEM